MKPFFILLMIALFGSVGLFSQTIVTNPWVTVNETGLSQKKPYRQIVPQAYKTLKMNLDQMQSLLSDAPMWQTEAAKNAPVVLSVPIPDGTFQNFQIVEAPIMHPELAEKFPMIKSYAGIGLDDPAAYIRFDLTPRGFHAMIRTPDKNTIFIDPYSSNDLENYISYYKKDFHKENAWTCHVDEDNQKNSIKKIPSLFGRAGDCQLRTYTLALACTGEYALFHGGTTNIALAAMVTTMTRVNGIYETDASVTMMLHPNTSSLIFLDPLADPYTNTNGTAMLAQNQTTCDNIIGNGNYDVGHVFSTGGGGIASLRSVCHVTNKARGVTGLPNPVGDPFDVDYVAHEFGHQFGANHTQNNSCQRNLTTAMEPGSASTIMGYAGICAPNVQSNSDDYFHAISIQEIAAHITNNGTNGGNTCSTNTTINGSPTANAGPNYTIPRSTPFVLTGSSTDPDNDPITYTWEQMDNAVATMPPLSTNSIGPAFRTYKGTTSPSRYLPRLQDLVNNVSPVWEVLSSVDRTYNWRLTVRDNHPGGGCTAESDMVVTVSAASGPFLVTVPNTAVTWPALTQQTVTWDVANTTAAPVSCANVDIFLSVDGGLTYPFTLASAVPNNGSFIVTLPNLQTTQARVMVKGVNNIFFDISNVNFSIECVLPIVNAPTVIQPTCPTQTGSIVVNATGVSTLEYSVDNGASWQVSNTFNDLQSGNYNIRVRLQAVPTCETVYTGNPIELIILINPLCGVAQIMGGSYYNTLQDAINDASDGNTIMLLEDISESNIVINKSVILDAGTFNLNASGLTIPSGKYMRWLNNNLTVPTGSSINNMGILWNNGTIIHTDNFTNSGHYKGIGNFIGTFINNGTFNPGN